MMKIVSLRDKKYKSWCRPGTLFLNLHVFGPKSTIINYVSQLCWWLRNYRTESLLQNQKEISLSCHYNSSMTLFTVDVLLVNFDDSLVCAYFGNLDLSKQAACGLGVLVLEFSIQSPVQTDLDSSPYT